MFTIYEQSGHTAYGIKRYICDTDSDVDELSIDDKVGSSAYVIDSGNMYFINSKGEWIKKKTSSGSSTGSSGGEDQSEEIAELKAQVEALQAQCDGHVTTIEELQQQIFELTYQNITSDTWSVLDGTVDEEGTMVLNNLDQMAVQDGILVVGG